MRLCKCSRSLRILMPVGVVLRRRLSVDQGHELFSRSTPELVMEFHGSRASHLFVLRVALRSHKCWRLGSSLSCAMHARA